MSNEMKRMRRNSEGEKMMRLEVEKKSPRLFNFLISYLSAFMIIIALTSCGGGGGGGGESSPTSTIAITFSGTDAPGSDAVYMTKNNELSNGNIMAIDVNVNNVSENVYGAAFDVDFDSSVVTYHGPHNPGNFLESGGSTVNYLMATDSGKSGKLIVGISKQGAASGTSGSGTLVTLMFDVTGDSSLSFSNNYLKDSNNQAISSISWYGGATYLN